MPLDLNNLGLGSLGVGNIIAGLIFSGIGFVAFTYGKKTGRFRLMGIGGALMVYCYFTPNTAMTCLIGAVLTGSIYFVRDEL